METITDVSRTSASKSESSRRYRITNPTVFRLILGVRRSLAFT